MLILPEDPGQVGFPVQSPRSPSSPMSSVIPPWPCNIPLPNLLTSPHDRLGPIPPARTWLSPCTALHVELNAAHRRADSLAQSATMALRQLLLHGGIDLAPCPPPSCSIFICQSRECFLSLSRRISVHQEPSTAVIQLLCNRSLGIQMLATYKLATVQTHDLGGLLSPNTILNSEIAFPPQTLIKTLIRHEVL